MARLWVHEAERVFRDRMVNDADMAKFDEFRVAVTKKFFEPCGGLAALEERPNLYCSFMQVSKDRPPLIHGVHITPYVESPCFTHHLIHTCPPHSLQATSDDVPIYTNVPSFESLKKVLDDKLREYNETNAVMDLVLFQQVWKCGLYCPALTSAV